MSRVQLNGGDVDLEELLSPRDNVLVKEAPITEPPIAGAPLTRASTTAPAATEPNSPGLPGSRSEDRGSVSFAAIGGPFLSYERTVTWNRNGGEISIDQRLSFRLDVPYWSWLYRWPAGRALRRGLDATERPWWSPPDRFSADQARVAAVATLLNVVGGMLYGLLAQVLTFASADLGNGTSGEQTNVLAVVRAGIVVAVLVSVLADRLGRRRVAIWAFSASALITLCTAFAPSLGALTGAQFISRNLAIAALLCVDTIAIEVVPAGSRAMIAGLGTLAYGLGAGFVVMTLPLADLGSWGWRLTFVAAGCTLPVIFHAKRHLPESARYRIMDRERSSASPPSDPASRPKMGPVSPYRLLVVGAMFVLLNVFLAPASQLQNDYLRTQARFSATTIAIFILVTSTPGGIGVLIGGRVADRFGRKWAIVPGLLAIGFFYSIFFATTSLVMWLSSFFAAVIGGMAAPALAVVTAELFPTSRRATIRGVVTGLAVSGAILGLVIGGRMIDRLGYPTAFRLLALAPAIGAALALLLPRTHGRELEETSA